MKKSLAVSNSVNLKPINLKENSELKQKLENSTIKKDLATPNPVNPKPKNLKETIIELENENFKLKEALETESKKYNSSIGYYYKMCALAGFKVLALLACLAYISYDQIVNH